jgi:hypothetical protein
LSTYERSTVPFRGIRSAAEDVDIYSAARSVAILTFPRETPSSTQYELLFRRALATAAIGGWPPVHPIDEATMRAHVAEADLRERQELARLFLQRARLLGVERIWALYEPDLIISIFLEERDLPRELELQALLISLLRNAPDHADAELVIRVADDDLSGVDVGEEVA